MSYLSRTLLLDLRISLRIIFIRHTQLNLLHRHLRITILQCPSLRLVKVLMHIIRAHLPVTRITIKIIIRTIQPRARILSHFLLRVPPRRSTRIWVVMEVAEGAAAIAVRPATTGIVQPISLLGPAVREGVYPNSSIVRNPAVRGAAGSSIYSSIVKPSVSVSVSYSADRVERGLRDTWSSWSPQKGQALSFAYGTFDPFLSIFLTRMSDGHHSQPAAEIRPLPC